MPCKWMELTKEGRHHVRVDAGCGSVAAFKITRKWQLEEEAKWRAWHPESTFDNPVCRECAHIARKLGLE